MSDWLMRVIKAEAKGLLELAAEDAELRADLRALAQEILAATAACEPGADSDSAPAKSPAEAASASTIEEGVFQGASTSEAAEIDSNPGSERLRELTLGRSFPARDDPRPDPVTMKRVETAHDDLDATRARCRGKSEAARWGAERLRRLGEGNVFPVENPAMDQELVEWADKLTDCFYWKTSANDSQPTGNRRLISLLDDVGGCFETAAEALSLVQGRVAQRSGHPRVLERVLPLIAEAQSALRAALQRLGAPDDPDQLEVFEWLKATAARQHVYLKRFMRADDAADPARWPELLARIESATASGQQSRQQSAQIEQVRDHLHRARNDGGNGHDWPAIMNAVDKLVEEGVPPSNREIRELLLPVIDDIPDRDDLPPGFRLVLREIDRFLAVRSLPPKSSVAHEPTAEVKAVARLLAGRSVLLIGGNRRREAQESLRRALGLLDLVWIETKEHQAVAGFEPLIVRPDVALVLLAIRWSSHAFGDVKLLCDRHGKPLARLPGGYSPNQVAAQILLQCSGQLVIGQ
jgi:hypothetical protein